jgi:hypothetical protein
MDLFDAIQNFLMSLSPILILAVIILLVFTSIFTPLFIWGIYNQTKKTAREIQKLNNHFNQMALPVRNQKKRKEPDAGASEEDSETFLTPVSKRFKD